MTTAQPALGRVEVDGPSSLAWNLWIGALAAGLLVGFGCFVYQWSNGLGVTGLSNTITWGLYIVAFMFLVGISAGGLIVVAGAELVDSHRFEQLNRLAVVVSAAAITTAAGSLLPDLGRPQYVWKMLVHPQPSSPLLWDMVVITAYLTIAVVDLWLLTRDPVNARAMRRMAVVTLPVAVAVHSMRTVSPSRMPESFEFMKQGMPYSRVRMPRCERTVPPAHSTPVNCSRIGAVSVPPESSMTAMVPGGTPFAR